MRAIWQEIPQSQMSVDDMNKYAKEELVAELTSVFLQQDLGVKLGNREVENHKKAVVPESTKKINDNENKKIIKMAKDILATTIANEIIVPTMEWLTLASGVKDENIVKVIIEHFGGKVDNDNKVVITPLLRNSITHNMKESKWELIDVDKKSLAEVNKKLKAINNGTISEKEGIEIPREKSEKSGVMTMEIEKTEKIVSPSEYYRNKNLKRLEAIDKNIPDDMKKETNWCAFKTYYNAETGKKRKVILSAQTSEWAKCNDPTTWSDYATAMEFAKAKNCEGLSFALESKNRIACIDLDHCINEKGMRSELCWDMLNASKGTYAEKSVSGTGMHIFFKGDNVLDGLNKHIENKGLECYDTAKFMSVTGNIVSKTNSLIECPEALKTKLTAELGSTQKSTRQAVSATPTNLTEHELIEKISKSKVGKDFDDMFRNGTDLCGDLSRTDAKLMSMLSFFTGQDSAMMKSIFEQSALYRPDKKNGYIDRTIDFVNANQTKSYTPPSQRANNNFKSKTK